MPRTSRLRLAVAVLAASVVVIGLLALSRRHGPPSIGSAAEAAAASALLVQAGGLVVPKRLFVVAGQPLGIYLSGIVPVPDPEVFRISAACTCAFATLERRRIWIAPPPAATGTHRLDIAVRAAAGPPDQRPIATAAIEIVVVPADAGRETAFQMLMVGDSLGAESRFPEQLAALLLGPGNPQVTFVGSHKPAGSAIVHEHYSGWTFADFTTRVGPHRRSPFVFPANAVAGGKPDFDVGRYLDETLGGARPAHVHIQLGTNDAFQLDTDAHGHGAELSAILQNAEILIAGLRRALPDAVITVGSVITSNATERAYRESYAAFPHVHGVWRWRRGQMVLARLMIARFESRMGDGIVLVPTHMLVDPIDGYNAHAWLPAGGSREISSALHPSAVGDRQMAVGIHAVVKAQFAGLTGFGR